MLVSQSSQRRGQAGGRTLVWTSRPSTERRTVPRMPIRQCSLVLAKMEPVAASFYAQQTRGGGWH
jgi:hypothetical protein